MSGKQRVLCGWELGAGLGHVSRLKPIVLELRDRGFEVFVALVDMKRAYAFCEGDGVTPLDGITVLAAPNWPMPNNPNAREVPTESFADVMNLIGFSDADLLENSIRAWSGLIETIRPDVILGDFAPSLRLAASGRVPMCMVGNGYTIPPPGRSAPPIRPWQETLQDFSIRHEEAILETVNAVLKKFDRPQIDFFSDMMNGDETFVFSLSIVDPYAEYRQVPSLAPFNLPRNIVPKPWSGRAIKRGVFYFPANHPDLKTAIDAAKRSGLKWNAYISNLPESEVAGLKSNRFRLSANPLDFACELPDARIIFHHGGLSTVVAATLAGTPQMILPWNLEHLVTARCIEKLGATTLPRGTNLAPDRLATGMVNLIRSDTHKNAARQAASTLLISGMSDGASVVADACMAMSRHQ